MLLLECPFKGWKGKENGVVDSYVHEIRVFRVQSVGLDVRRFLILSLSHISHFSLSLSLSLSPSPFQASYVKARPPSIHSVRTYLRYMINRPRAPTLDVEIPSLSQRVVLTDQDLFHSQPPSSHPVRTLLLFVCLFVRSFTI